MEPAGGSIRVASMPTKQNLGAQTPQEKIAFTLHGALETGTLCRGALQMKKFLAMRAL
jgi:hypothetical protein